MRHVKEECIVGMVTAKHLLERNVNLRVERPVGSQRGYRDEANTLVRLISKLMH